MKIKIKFFGQLAELIGKEELEISGIMNTDALTKKLLDDFPDLKNHSFQLAINKKIIKKKQELKSGNEVVFLPPFAGG